MAKSTGGASSLSRRTSATRGKGRGGKQGQGRDQNVKRGTSVSQALQPTAALISMHKELQDKQKIAEGGAVGGADEDIFINIRRLAHSRMASHKQVRITESISVVADPPCRPSLSLSPWKRR